LSDGVRQKCDWFSTSGARLLPHGLVFPPKQSSRLVNWIER
jgi:hypothetical protein